MPSPAAVSDYHPRDDSDSRPAFVLSRPQGTVMATGRTTPFDNAADAATALASGAVTSVVGALAFRPDHPAALHAPDALVRRSRPWTRPAGSGRTPRADLTTRPDPDHGRRITAALARLRDASDPLRKVVLARHLDLATDTDVDPVALLSDLVDGTPTGNGFCVDLSPAGPSFAGRVLVGSSPEVLVRRDGHRISIHPLAGSAPRFDDAAADWASGRSLIHSSKDIGEHAVVIDALRAALQPWCRDLEIPTTPTLTHTPQLWHLGTPITGVLRDSRTTALDLAVALHPTPAVCGTPTGDAYDLIDALEGDRGFYAGAVGWCDAAGDGEWIVAIRCAEIGPDRRTIRAWAGGGIVAESDPDDEIAETVTKFGTVLRAFGATL